MKQITEQDFAGWNPSACDNDSPGSEEAPFLLRMDNLTQDELGNLRLAKGKTLEAVTEFLNNDILNIYSTYLDGVKTRFVYFTDGAINKAIMCTETDPTDFTLILTANYETSRKCAFLNVLGHVIMCAGGIQEKYNVTNNFPLSLPAPPPLEITGHTVPSVDLSDVDGGGNYVNWLSLNSTLYDNTGTNVTGTAAPDAHIADELVFQDVYASVIDTTNFGGTGNDSPDDIFSFNLKVSDVRQLKWVLVEVYNQTPSGFGGGLGFNYSWWKEWDFNTGFDQSNSPYKPFDIQSDVTTKVTLKRKDFFLGGDPARNWTTIKAIRIHVGIETPADGTAAGIVWDSPLFTSGAVVNLSGQYNYVAVQVYRSETMVQFSPASTPVTVTTSWGAVAISPGTDGAGAILPINAGANELWIFRQDTEGGAYLRVASFIGDFGLTPSTYTDDRAYADLVFDANINPTYILQYYRQNLPNTITDMIWFRDRVIYLTANGFIPSFKFDPGSYDARFVYEVAATTSEKMLFIVKLDVGTFIVATTNDFYRVNGTFALQIDPTDITGETQYLDVTITPLGVSDPAVHHAFIEFQGAIFYASASGIRVLTGGTSTLVNDNLDLLFRKEDRYGLTSINIEPLDQSTMAVASQGNRIYWSLPNRDGNNRIYIQSMHNQTNAANLMNRSWRMWTHDDDHITLNPISLYREDDGTLLCAGKNGTGNFLYSLESASYVDSPDSTLIFLPVHIKTRFNYCGGNTTRKDALVFRAKIDTGGNLATLKVFGLQYDGSILDTTFTFNTLDDSFLELDLKETLPPSVAYSLELTCYTNRFNLDWFTFIVEERPPGVRRAIQYVTNFDKSGRKRVVQWPFLADPMGLLSNAPTTITANVTADNIALASQTFTGTGIQTFRWQCDPAVDRLATDWGIELIGDDTFELFKILDPIIVEETPPSLILQTISPSNDFGIPARKRLGSWPFRANLRSSTIKVVCTIDKVPKAALFFTAGDWIETFYYIPPDGILGVDFQLEISVTAGNGIEFYEFMKPDFIQVCPIPTHQAIMPRSNLGNPRPKKIATWPFVAHSLGNTISVIVTVDGVAQAAQTFTSSDISTMYWLNNVDIIGVDWQIEAHASTQTTANVSGGNYAPPVMEFYKFLTPDVQQVFPIERVWDQIGPLDFNKKGLVYGARFRIYSAGNVHYKVYENDTLAYENDIAITPNIDNAYLEDFIKGINPAVCRIVITADQIFYRFSVEYKVRITGNETEDKYIMVPDNAISR